jgi:cytochrome P450
MSRPWPFLERAHRAYGDAFTIRVGSEPPWIVLAAPDAVREVFTGDPDVFHAGEGNVVLRPVLGANSVLVLDGPAHLRQRRLLLPPFHGDRLARWTETMREVAEREVTSWAPGAPIPVRRRMQHVALEIVMRVVFGAGGDSALRDALSTMLDRITRPQYQVVMAALGLERFERWNVLRRELQPVDDLLRRTIRERDRGGDDVLSVLIEQDMGEDELRDELITLLVAGHETTAGALAWAAERLARHPAAFERLTEDAYAEAVVRETLRLRPVLSVVVRRLTRDARVAGLDLRAGTAVAPCIHLVHRRPDLYPEPRAFRPERFLDANPGTYTWLPFGGGVRRCIGASFAELEMRIVLQALRRRAGTLRPATDRAEPAVRRAVTLVPARDGTVVVGR